MNYKNFISKWQQGYNDPFIEITYHDESYYLTVTNAMFKLNDFLLIKKDNLLVASLAYMPGMNVDFEFEILNEKLVFTMKITNKDDIVKYYNKVEEFKVFDYVKESNRLKTNVVIDRSKEEIEVLVNDLLSNMTLDEKVGQTMQLSNTSIAAFGESNEKLDCESLARMGMLSSILSGESGERYIELQRIASEESRLKIPLIINQDVIHGMYSIYPIPLAVAGSFDLDLIHRLSRMEATEAAYAGIHVNHGPMVDVSTDPRWGRVMEGAGEDVFLASEISKTKVKALQGEKLNDDDKILACLKHFVGYGAAQAGRDYNTTIIDETSLRNTYLPPFKAGIEAGAKYVMTAFNTIDNIPISANKRITKNLLREEFAFDGVLLSDFAAVKEVLIHGSVSTEEEAAIACLEAGLDMEMMTLSYFTYIKKAILENKLDSKYLDETVKRILTVKYELGLFDDPYRYFNPLKLNEVKMSSDYRKLCLEAASKSIVLLENKNVLPLKKQDRVCFLGKHLNNKDILGAWTIQQAPKDKIVSLKEGLENINIFVNTCDYTDFEKLEKFLKDYDKVVLSIGEDENDTGEAASKTNITLSDEQLQLVKFIAALNKKIVVVLHNGRPLDITTLKEYSDAILVSWWLGIESGNAIARTLYGINNPSAKLTMSWPRNVGQIPVYYNHFNTGRPVTDVNKESKFISKFIDSENTPLYPFGYGLSYSDFTYSNFKLSKNEMKLDDVIIASIDVTNNSLIKGEEIVQMYIQDVYGKLQIRPIKELKGFKRVTLDASETKTITFEITKDLLEYYSSIDGYTVEKGLFRVSISKDSTDKNYLEFNLV